MFATLESSKEVILNAFLTSRCSLTLSTPGNVAQDLREWIEAVGYTVAVTGGGRIDYRPNENMAVVYGFSYGFGKGDHAFASSLINKWTNGTIRASYDNSEGLY